jgi:hypothetical protein
MAPGLPSIIDIAERFDQYAYSCSKFNLSQVTSYLVYRRNAILPVLDYAGCDYAKLLQDCQDQALRVRRLRYETRRLLMLAGKLHHVSIRQFLACL